MSQQPPPMMAPPEAAAVPAEAFPQELIMQISAETGYSPETIAADIARTGATTKEQLYPQFYEGRGIEPQVPAEGQTVDPDGMGAVQESAAAVPAPVSPEGGMPMPMAPGGGLPPEALEAMRKSMAPAAKAARRR